MLRGAKYKHAAISSKMLCGAKYKQLPAVKGASKETGGLGNDGIAGVLRVQTWALAVPTSLGLAPVASAANKETYIKNRKRPFQCGYIRKRSKRPCPAISSLSSGHYYEG